MAAGVQEEFHTVDLATRRLTARAGRLVEQLRADRFSSELQRSVLAANSRPRLRLADLAADIAALRRAAITVAQSLGLGIVAAGTVPIADPDTLTITPDPRYEHMQGEDQMLVREQLICGTQVHVDVNDRDLAVAAAHRVAPWLPALLALSASSPFWLGTDTGYASYRTLIWRRWPTTGAAAGFASAADYDQAVADLVRSGVSDPGMTCFDVRPSAHLPTVELRGVSVKVRAGRALEVKAYRGSRGILQVPGRARGHLEAWQKWSFPCRPLRQDSAGPGGWQPVLKRRRISRFSRASGPAAARAPVPGGEPWCAVELTEVRTRGRDWWTLGFEATGPADLLHGELQATAALVFARPLPAGVEPGPDYSRSYAEWLGRPPGAG